MLFGPCRCCLLPISRVGPLKPPFRLFGLASLAWAARLDKEEKDEPNVVDGLAIYWHNSKACRMVCGSTLWWVTMVLTRSRQVMAQAWGDAVQRDKERLREGALPEVCGFVLFILKLLWVWGALTGSLQSLRPDTNILDWQENVLLLLPRHL